MSSEGTSLRINPTMTIDEQRDALSTSSSANAKVYQSWQDAILQSHATHPDRQLIVVIDVDDNCGRLTANSTQLNEGASGSGTATIPHCHFEATSQFSYESGGFTQQLTRCVSLEFQRVNQEVTVNRNIDSFNERLQSLSNRELDVLILIVQGRTCKEMANKLAVGIATVAKHRAKLFKKLGVRNCIELMHLLSSFFSEQGPSSEHV